MYRDLFKGLEQIPDYLIPSHELLDELNYVSDEEKEEQDEILTSCIDKPKKQDLINPDIEAKDTINSSDHHQSPDGRQNHTSPKLKKPRLSSSPRSTSAPVTVNLQQSPHVKTPTFPTTSILSTMSTPTDLRSYSSTFDGSPFLKNESSPDTVSLERIVTSLSISSNGGIKKDSALQKARNTPKYSPQKQEDNFAVPDPPRQSYLPQQHQNEPFAKYDPRRQQKSQPPHESDVITINRHDYSILKEIGKGSTGRVYQVLSHTYNEIFALKWIEVNRQEDRQAVINEIELLNSLKRQESIVRLLDYDIGSSVILMIMEYGEIDFATLIQKQLEKKWDISFIRYYWKQMLQSVSIVHQHKIVHSDLKPANFVIVKGWLKLIDFGIAMKFSDDTTSVHRAVQVGTINYMSPEALTQNNNVTKLGRSSDIWSLGCMLYQLVYGQTPFHHLQLTQKLISIPNPNYEISFPHAIKKRDEETIIPPKLIDLLKDCLNRNPLKRPSINDLLRHPFVNNC